MSIYNTTVSFSKNPILRMVQISIRNTTTSFLNKEISSLKIRKQVIRRGNSI